MFSDDAGPSTADGKAMNVFIFGSLALESDKALNDGVRSQNNVHVLHFCDAGYLIILNHGSQYRLVKVNSGFYHTSLSQM